MKSQSILPYDPNQPQLNQPINQLNKTLENLDPLDPKLELQITQDINNQGKIFISELNFVFKNFANQELGNLSLRDFLNFQIHLEKHEDLIKNYLIEKLQQLSLNPQKYRFKLSIQHLQPAQSINLSLNVTLTADSTYSQPDDFNPSLNYNRYFNDYNNFSQSHFINHPRYFQKNEQARTNPILSNYLKLLLVQKDLQTSFPGNYQTNSGYNQKTKYGWLTIYPILRQINELKSYHLNF